MLRWNLPADPAGFRLRCFVAGEHALKENVERGGATRKVSNSHPRDRSRGGRGSLHATTSPPTVQHTCVPTFTTMIATYPMPPFTTMACHHPPSKCTIHCRPRLNVRCHVGGRGSLQFTSSSSSSPTQSTTAPLNRHDIILPYSMYDATASASPA